MEHRFIDGLCSTCPNRQACQNVADDINAALDVLPPDMANHLRETILCDGRGYVRYTGDIKWNTDQEMGGA